MNFVPQQTIPLPPRIALWIGDERVAQQVREALSEDFGTISHVADMQQLSQWLDGRYLEIVIADSLGAGGYAAQLADRCQTDGCRAVLVAADSSLASWPQGDSTTPPFTTIPVGISSAGIRAIVAAAAKQAKVTADLQRSRKRLSQAMTHELVGYSPVITGLRQVISAAAADPNPLFLCGESGTGKKLISRMVHALSDRAHAPRISLNCRILPSTQLDRELFIGGDATRDGFGGTPSRLEMARGGFLVLEDVDQISLPLQVRLMRSLTGTGEFSRPADVRLICLSSRPLKELVAEGVLREDFAAFISAKTIMTPPLREHREDICQIVENMLQKIAIREGRPACRLTTDALQVLQAYNWPGNVLELQNVVERSVSVAEGFRLSADTVLPWMNSTSNEEDSAPCMTLEEMERRLIEATFTRFGGNRERTASALQIGLRTLSGKLRDYGYPPRGGPGSNLKIAERRAA